MQDCPLKGADIVTFWGANLHLYVFSVYNNITVSCTGNMVPYIVSYCRIRGNTPHLSYQVGYTGFTHVHIGLRDLFVGELRPLARTLSPALARKSSGFARILIVFLPQNGNFQILGGCMLQPSLPSPPPPPPPPRTPMPAHVSSIIAK